MLTAPSELGVLHARLDMKTILLIKELEKGVRTMDDATYNGINEKLDHIQRVIARLEDRAEKLDVMEAYQYWYHRWLKMYQDLTGIDL